MENHYELPFVERIRANYNDAGAWQWVKCAFGCLIYIVFIAWVGNWWWLLLLPVIADMFIGKVIPWTIWKKIKNRTLYTICSWIDAIVFALIAVYFINQYLFQNYQIPSSSLEKSLLVGDFLFVSKASYGPRIPNTPLSMPLVQHTFPEWLGGGKSYIEKPQWEYRRLAGFDTISRGDIVVFNFPAGDTVPTKVSNPDYYTLCHYVGKERLHNDKQSFGDIVYRPVDRRENYVKRCVGLPGDTLQIIDNQIYINSGILQDAENVQYNYIVQTKGNLISKSFAQKIGIAHDDYLEMRSDEAKAQLYVMGLDPTLPAYHFPLTREMLTKLQHTGMIDTIVCEPEIMGGEVYPLGHNNWTRDNYGPIYMPRKGQTVKLDSANYFVYERCIRNYEHNECELKNGQIFINGEPTDQYTFKMNYYWMMGDNRHKSADSRYWGFVPEDHIVGRPVFIWLSLDKDKNFFSGKIRWNRLFKKAGK